MYFFIKKKAYYDGVLKCEISVKDKMILKKKSLNKLKVIGINLYLKNVII